MRREADESGEAQQPGRQLNSAIRRVGGPGCSSVRPSRRRRCPKLAETGGPITPPIAYSARAMRGANYSFGKT